ncbi:uncharacterized protein METZ01_LOCUS269148, partial [marine metagenome]
MKSGNIAGVVDVPDEKVEVEASKEASVGNEDVGASAEV